MDRLISASKPVRKNVDRRKESRKGAGRKRQFVTFKNMELEKPVFDAVMRLGFRNPTPIQRRSITALKSGADAILIARTGSGKTAAFSIPIVNSLLEHRQIIGARALILSPTRELAIQTGSFIRKLSKFTDLRTCLLVGGESMEDQFEALAANPDIIVATPGRLLHHMEEVELSLASVQHVVFDEADRLFEMGFAAPLETIRRALPDSCQTALVSATLPGDLAEFTRARLREPVLIRLDVDKKLPPTLGTQFFLCERDSKLAALFFICREVIPPGEQAIIFTPTRYHAELVNMLLEKARLCSVVIFGSMDPSSRKSMTSTFRKGDAQFLSTTDLAARGLDLPDVKHIISFEFPPSPKLFAHRVGRTARANKDGTAWSLVTPDELPYLLDTFLFLGRSPVFAKDLASSVLEADAAELPIPKAGSSLDGVIGSISRVVLDSENEWLVSIRKMDADIPRLEKTARNGMKAYFKTRPGASNASAARARTFLRESTSSMAPLGYHPTAQACSSAGAQPESLDAVAITAALRAFRPNVTAMEFGKLPTDEGALAVQRHREKTREHMSIMKAATDEIQRVSRASGDKFAKKGSITLTQRQKTRQAMQTAHSIDDIRAELGLDTMAQGVGPLRTRPTHGGEKDKFLSLKHGDNERQQEVLEDAVLELLPEDGQALLQVSRRRQRQQWDPVKKRFVYMNNQKPDNASFGERTRGRKKIRTESGATVSVRKSKGGDDDADERRGKKKSLYEQWKSRTQREIPSVGAREDDRTDASVLSYQGFGRKKRRFEKAPASKVNRAIEKQFRPDSQILKMRRRKDGMRRRMGRGRR
eukprot:gnl/Chilomastix_cuspidata/760.p1 GENE.gnl/Chilomastix_cuspidata/760~~gnl/Chilomastix_cuspidata/760.p1  ORF type:complete len:820 (+),score=138.79 gnl/Chilomastix_cuspidata/760:33-2492(+)